jgi:hypothetical protein
MNFCLRMKTWINLLVFKYFKYFVFFVSFLYPDSIAISWSEKPFLRFKNFTLNKHFIRIYHLTLFFVILNQNWDQNFNNWKTLWKLSCIYQAVDTRFSNSYDVVNILYLC